MTGFPLELGRSARGQKTKVLGLPNGRKSFKIVLAFRHNTECDRHPASHVAVAKTALAERRAGKNGNKKKRKSTMQFNVIQ